VTAELAALWRRRANAERDRDGNIYAQRRAEEFDRIADKIESDLVDSSRKIAKFSHHDDFDSPSPEASQADQDEEGDRAL
jgi:hypothetical protein